MLIKDYLYQPIPKSSTFENSSVYGQIEFDEANSLYKEELVNLFSYGISTHSYYYKNGYKNASNKIWCRKTVANKLQKINEKLKKLDLEIVVLDAYRPIELQIELWDDFLQQAKDIGAKNPIEYAEQYCSNPTKFDKKNNKTWPVHSSGGSVDIKLIDSRTKKELYIGGEFDELSETSHTYFWEDKFLKEKKLSRLEKEALQNRRILFNIMKSEGFTNYSYEFWHYDYGTQMWAMNKNAEEKTNSYRAWYGYMPKPEGY